MFHEGGRSNPRNNPLKLSMKPSQKSGKSMTVPSLSSNSPNINSVPTWEQQMASLNESRRKELYAEIVLAASIPPHPNVIQILAFSRSPLCIVMEYMTGGSVMELVYGLTKRQIPSVSKKLLIIIKACCGLQHLTQNGLHHRDIAARNILMGHYEDVIDEGTLVKITDFGMSRKKESGNMRQKTRSDDGPYKWMAPESIQRKEYNEKTDVYMFGITMWEIMYGQEPYPMDDAINVAMKVCMKGERPHFEWDLPLGMKTVIRKCWAQDPVQRPDFKSILSKLEQLEQGMYARERVASVLGSPDADGVATEDARNKIEGQAYAEICIESAADDT